MIVVAVVMVNLHIAISASSQFTVDSHLAEVIASLAIIKCLKHHQRQTSRACRQRSKM